MMLNNRCLFSIITVQSVTVIINNAMDCNGAQLKIKNHCLLRDPKKSTTSQKYLAIDR
jgi:hypothetical protein